MLFTTETFAMGINMPAKTVVFTSMEKFDGDQFRNISGGEYIQMSGRAGRRGLDDRGITILMANKKLEPDSAKAILKGQSDPLYSSFHLGYNMLLNMMRIEDIHPEDILMHSFHQFQQERKCPQLKKNLISKLQEYKSITVEDHAIIEKKQKLELQNSQIEEEIRKIVVKPENIVPFLVPGRLIKIKSDQHDWGWGILASFSKQRITSKNKSSFDFKNKGISDIVSQTESNYILDVYLYCKDKLTTDNFLQPGTPLKKDGRLGIVPVLLHYTTVQAISTIQLNLPHNHRENDNVKTVELMYMELLKRFDQGNTLKLLDPIQDMEIEYDPDEGDDVDIKQLIEAKEKVATELSRSKY